MNTIKACFHSITSNLAYTPMGIGIKAISSALKAIHSLGKPKNAQSASRTFASTPRDYITLTPAETRQFQTYKAGYGNDRDEKIVRAEFGAILEIIVFFKDETNMWTDMRYGQLREKLPEEIQRDIQKHFQAVKGFTGEHTAELNSKHVSFFKRLIKPSVQFNLTQNTIKLIPGDGNSRPVVRKSTTRRLSSVITMAAVVPADQQDRVLATGSATRVMQVWKCRRDKAKHFVSYRDKYGAGRDIHSITKEYFAMANIINLARQRPSNLYIELHQFRAMCPADLRKKLDETLSYSSQGKIQEFIGVLRARINSKDFIAYMDATGNRPKKDIIIREIIAVVKSRPEGFNTPQCGRLIQKLPFEVRKGVLHNSLE